MKKDKDGSHYDWRVLLTEWSAALLESNDLNDEPPPEAIKNGWLGYPGATEEQIRLAEERLGVRLPPSYRAFLKVTNGWPQITTFIYKMWSAEEIDWFRVRNEEWATIWNENNYEIPDEEYFVYDDNQSPDFRTEYLLTALEISDRGDSCIFLLNPQVVTPEGEWEAWFFANWMPGARRYRSFREMMQAEYKSFLSLRDL
jgi:hypothetical protein